MRRVVIVSFILIFAAAAAYTIFYKKQTAPIIEILSAEEIQHVITTDADNYYEKFHAVDLKVRQVKNKEAYLDKISGSGCAAEEDIIQKVKDCIEAVNAHLSRNETIHGIHIDTFLKIPWRIGFICDRKYENGLPHTRGDVIILNSQDIRSRTTSEVCKLLIHEKSHVYQKKEKDKMDTYLKTKYTEVKRKDYTDETIPANPDTNDTVYKCNETKVVLEGKYRKNPTHFRDVEFTRNDHTLEHPFETIAYNMEELYY
jgi:hypothetical protein